MTQQQQLWSDDAICEELGATSDAHIDYASSFAIGLDIALKVIKTIRDDYEADRTALAARVAELEETIDELQDALDGMRGIAKDRQARVGELEAEVERQRARADTAREWANEQIDQLRAQLAQTQTWQPVENGMQIDCQVNSAYGVCLFARQDGSIEAYDPCGDEPEQVFVFLPDDVRLCRLAPQEIQEGGNSEVR